MGYFRAELIEKLKKLDLEASLSLPGARRLQCVLVGGGALVIKQYIERSTYDIDLLRASKELHGMLEKYDMNTNVAAHLDCFPESYPKRAERLVELETRKIDYYVLSLEDLVISKLAAHRPQDMADIHAPDIIKSINWDLLHELSQEMEEVFLSDRAAGDFKTRYEAFIKENKENIEACER